MNHDNGTALAESAREEQARRWRHLQDKAARFVVSESVVPPLSMPELLERTDRLAAAAGVVDATERKLLAIMIHNEAWRNIVARVPYERRLLLLPQCLRAREECPADTDEFGLLCRECGACPLGELQREAAELGYVVLISEGTTEVTGLLKDGTLDAVVGASCLSALEESFPHVAEQAIPALAVPLLTNGCNRTDVDLCMLREDIRTIAEPAQLVGPSPSVDDLRQTVRQWFEPDELDRLLQADGSHAVQLAVDWLSRSGKRWRPLLTASAYAALRGDEELANASVVRAAAVAVECFHKASLIHDDIEDGDFVRYGMETFHKQYGVPIALNAGDLLIGEGYRLLAESAADDATRVKMLGTVSMAHRRLCIGQGEELRWMRQPDVPTLDWLLRLFRHKTAPAFEAALLLGAVAAGADETTCHALGEFSRTLGIAYQIRDDLLDMHKDTDWQSSCIQQPSMILAVLCDRCNSDDRREIRNHLRRDPNSDHAAPDFHAMCLRHDVLTAAEDIQQEHRQRVLGSLKPLGSVPMKRMLTRLVARILPHESP